MSALTVCLLSGNDAGKRVRLQGETLTFGRGSACNLPLQIDVASREQGQLTATDAGWSITASGSNPTRVNGRKIGKRPVALTSGDTIAIGDQDAFQVAFTPPARTPHSDDDSTAHTEQDAIDPEARARKRKTKLWISIGIYLMIMLGLFIFFSTLPPNSKQISLARELTDTDIKQLIRAPLPARPRDDFLAQQAIDEAEELYHRLDASKDALFRAHRAYQQALAYRNPQPLAGKDHLRFDELEKQLVEQVTQQYRSAYNLLRGGRYEQAAKAFRELTEIYDDPTSPIYKNVQQHWSAAKKQDR